MMSKAEIVRLPALKGRSLAAVLLSALLSLIVVPGLSLLTGAIVDTDFYLSFQQYLLLVCVCLVLGLHLYVFSQVPSPALTIQMPEYDTHAILRVIRIIAFLGIIAFMVNISRVLRVGLSLQGAGREYELLFGKYTLINYVYYLNGFVVGISGILVAMVRDQRSRRRLVRLAVLCALTLPFHAVKSTILFPPLIALLGYTIVTGRIPKTLAFTVAVVTIAAFAVVNYVVRYGQGFKMAAIIESLLLYLTPGYSNLFFEVRYPSNYDFGRHLLGFMFQLLEVFGLAKPSPSVLHLVDPAYNVGTIFRDAYKDFGWFGFYIYLFLISSYSAFAVRRTRKTISISAVYWLAITCVQLLFMFWGNHFTKFQYIYWLLVGIIFHRMTRVSPVLVNEPNRT